MTSAYLNRTPRSRLQAAYDVCPELREAVEALWLVFLLAKGYAAANPVGSNAEFVEQAHDILATIQAMESEK